MRHRLLLLCAAFVGCATVEEEPSGADGAHFELAQTAKLGVYLVDGTTNDEENNSIVVRLAQQVSGEVAQVQYFAGPDLACLECEADVRAVTRRICDDLESGRTNMFAVFGYSRGVFIANAAANAALARCNPRAPLPLGSSLTLASPYVYGGFLDGVEMNLSSALQGANWVGPGTMFRHLYRADPNDSTFLPVTMIGGGRQGSANIKGPAMGHVDLAFNDTVRDQIAAEANAWSGFRIFNSR